MVAGSGTLTDGGDVGDGARTRDRQHGSPEIIVRKSGRYHEVTYSR